jgi:transcriptional regulator with XRE-family HTH domain
MKIGYKFRRMRKILDLTLEEVAEKVGTNITTLSMFERDSANISMHTFLDLCSFYGVEMLDMMEIEIGNSFLQYIKNAEDIGKNILLCRTLAGYSRYKLAELADCSEVTISLIEKNILIPTVDTFRRLVIIFAE